jgi:hypothetical protein
MHYNRETGMPQRFQHGFENDVFISYTHVDDEADVTGRKWVSQFESDLRTRLIQVSGYNVASWRDNKLGAADRFDGEIAAQVRKSAVLVTVLTPSYFHSEYCRKERELFWLDAGDIGNKARVVKVAKTRVELNAYPPDLKSLLEYRFYVEEPSGVCREFHLHEDPLVQRRYATRIDDVALEIAGILKLLEAGGSAPATRKGAVFLAETSSDLEEPRAEIRRSLLQRGYEVLPTAPLRLLTAPQIRESVAADLARSAAAIHPIGAAYGVIPESGSGASIVRIQLESVANRQGTFSRLIWIPAGVQPSEEPQVALISRIRNEWAGNPFQLIEGPLQDFETDLLDTLERPNTPAPPVNFKLVKRRPSVYLLSADEADRNASRSVRFWLHGQEIDVEWPSREGDAAQKHLRHLLEDDGFLIYYGQASDDWVRASIAEIAASELSGRATPILSRAVFLADPQTEDKLDFLTHDARILEGYGGATPVEQILTPFLSEIRAGWPRNSTPPGGKP